MPPDPTIEPVSRRISNLLRTSLEEEWVDPDEIACFVARQLKLVYDIVGDDLPPFFVVRHIRRERQARD